MSDIPMRRPLTDEQIPLVGGGKIHWPYGPDIPFLSPDGGIGSRFDHGSSAVIATLREKDAEIAELKKQIADLRRSRDEWKREACHLFDVAEENAKENEA